MTEWGDTICSFLSAKKEENDANLRHQLAATMPTPGRGGYPSATAGNFGTLPSSSNNYGISSGTYGVSSGTYGMASSYSSSPYGTYSLSTLPPLSPGHYGVLSHPVTREVSHSIYR